MAGRSWDQAYADLRRKYGEPTKGQPSRSGGEISYCDRAEQRCNTAYGKTRPAMAVNIMEGGSMRLALMAGSIADTAWQASLNKAVAARTGGSGNSF